jgi:hypothetical protein
MNLRSHGVARSGVLLVVVLLGVGLGLAGQVRAEDYYDSAPGLLTVPPNEDAFAADRPNVPPPVDRAARAGYSVSSVILSAFTFPLKLAAGVGGAFLGGAAGAMTGGDEETAAGIWNVTTDGDYFVTPRNLRHRPEFRFAEDYP